MFKILFSFFKQIFTWWHNQTVGTRLFTFLKGRHVGSDIQGNHYYTTRNGQRRWVIYNGLVEASRIPAVWDSWLRYTRSTHPKNEDADENGASHLPNVTGTPLAHHPAGSLHALHRSSLKTTYTAWRPEK